MFIDYSLFSQRFYFSLANLTRKPVTNVGNLNVDE